MPVLGAELGQLDCNGEGVPHVLEDLMRFVEDNGVGVRGIFRLAGNKRMTAKLLKYIEKTYQHRRSSHPSFSRDVLESVLRGEDVEVVTVNVSIVLKMIFNRLPHSLLLPMGCPDDLYSRYMSSHSDSAEVRSLIARHLPGTNAAVLRRLVAMLRRVADGADENLMTSANLAIVWGPNLLYLPEGPDETSAFASNVMQMDALLAEIKVTNSLVKMFIDEGVGDANPTSAQPGEQEPAEPAVVVRASVAPDRPPPATPAVVKVSDPVEEFIESAVVGDEDLALVSPRCADAVATVAAVPATPAAASDQQESKADVDVAAGAIEPSPRAEDLPDESGDSLSESFGGHWRTTLRAHRKRRQEELKRSSSLVAPSTPVIMLTRALLKRNGGACAAALARQSSFGGMSQVAIVNKLTKFFQPRKVYTCADLRSMLADQAAATELTSLVGEEFTALLRETLTEQSAVAESPPIPQIPTPPPVSRPPPLPPAVPGSASPTLAMRGARVLARTARIADLKSNSNFTQAP